MEQILTWIIPTAYAAVQFGTGPAAEPQFVSLTHIPGLTQAGNLPELLQNLFLITIGFAGILGVIMIAIGGVEYMGSDSFSTKGNGKKRITAAVQGLVIILASYLILNTINPQLLNLNIISPPLGSGTGGAASGVVIFTFPDNGTGDANLQNLCSNAHGIATIDPYGSGKTVCLV